MKNRTFWIWVGVIVILFLLLMFWGCQRKDGGGAAQSPEQISAAISRPFDAKATIRLKDLVMTADINKTSADALTMIIEEPKTLSGMKFSYDGTDITVSYMGLSIKLDENSKLVSSAANLIVGALNKAASPSGIDVRLQEGALLVSGKSDDGDFSIKLDKANGSIVSIALPELDFTCNFDDFVFKK